MWKTEWSIELSNVSSKCFMDIIISSKMCKFNYKLNRDKLQLKVTYYLNFINDILQKWNESYEVVNDLLPASFLWICNMTWQSGTMWYSSPVSFDCFVFNCFEAFTFTFPCTLFSLIIHCLSYFVSIFSL